MNPEINRPPNGDRVGFLFTWRHKDGSIVTFCTDGWSSSDPEKSAWLNEMARLTSSVPCISPFVRGEQREGAVRFAGLDIRN